MRLESAIEKAGVWEWKPGYIDNTVLDGESWSILINDANGILESSGLNKYPKGFDAFLDCLRDLFGLEVHPPERGYEGLSD